MASIDQPVLAIADADALSARIALTSGSLYLGSDLASGSYAIDLVADDGDLVSSPFVLTLTVESPVAFETLIIEGEALTPVDDGNTNTGDDSLIRTRTQNQERAGELNPDGQPLGSNETLGVDFDEYGLRPDYLGDGYFDINGPSGGKAETTLPDTFPMVAGSYDVYVRIANGSSSNRAITVGVDDVSATIAETQTGEFYFWGVRKVTLNLLEKTTDEARTLTVSTSASNGPNIDAIAIVEAGTPFSFVAPEITSSGAFSVDENTLSVGEVTAIDLDGETVTFSIVDSGDGAFFDINPDTGELAFKAAPDFETGPNTYTLTVEATDGAKTTAQTITVNVQDVPELDTPTIAPIILQGEDAVVPGGSNANTDDGTATFHRVQNDSATEETATNGQFDVFGLRVGYSGYGYTDFGGDGDGFDGNEKITWTVNVAEAGLYDFHVRYASTGVAGDRPLDIIVGGSTQIAAQDFQGTNFETWDELTVQITLASGDNELTLAIPTGENNGPNIDAVAITTVGEPKPVWPPVNTGPVYAAETATADIDENTVAVGSFAATDAESDDLSYTLTGPDAGGFGIDGDGNLSFSAAPDFEGSTKSADGDNVYDVSVEASDGVLSATQNVTVNVQDVTEPVAIGGATLAVNAGGDLNDSTFSSGTIRLENTGTKDIAKVTIDLSAALFTNANSAMVFDPSGEAGDATAKGFESNGQTGTYTITSALSGGSDATGYSTLELTFDAFETGDALNFSIDIDPDSIKGVSGDGDAGSVSGLELTGSIVTVEYADGTSASSALFADGSQGGAVATVSDTEPAAPTLSLDGAEGQVRVDSATQTVSVSGPSDATVTVVLATGGLGNGVTAQSLFDANTATDVTYQTVTLDTGGLGSFDVTLMEGVPFYMAASVDGDGTGQQGAVSAPLVVAYEEPPVDLAYDVPSDGDLVIELANRDGSIVINDDTGTGEGDPLSTQFRDKDNIEGVQTGRDDGLWNGYQGAGYLDMGGNLGDQVTFDVTVEAAGDYTFVFRYNNGSTFNSGVRPLDIAVDGTVQATPDFANNGLDWTDWQTETVTLTLPDGTSTISLTNTVDNGPNIDQVKITPPAPVDADPTALNVTAVDITEEVAGAEVATVTVDDVDTTYAAVDLALTDPSDQFELVDTGTPNTFTLKLKTGETLDFEAASQPILSVSLGTLSQGFVPAPLNDTSDDPIFEPVTIQGEDATVIDTLGTTGGALTDTLVDGETDAFDNTLGVERTGQLGPQAGFLDFGQNPGDTGQFTVTVPHDGTYSATFRYAQGSDPERPLELSVDGAVVETIPFAQTGVSNDADRWNVFADVTVELQLKAGDNVVALSIPTPEKGGVNNGPNIDQVTFALVEADPSVLTVTGIDPQPAENVAGAEVATVTVDDVDTTYAATDLTLNDPSGPFELVETGTANTFTLKLKAGEALDFEATSQPTVTVGLGALSQDFTPAPTNDASDDAPANAAPVVQNAAQPETTDEDTSVVIDVADLIADDTDVDQALTITAEATSGTVVVNGTALTFTPEPDFNGDATITYRAEDTEGDVSADATIAVSVTPVDDAPTAVALTAIDVLENVAGAAVATVTVEDVDTVYALSDLTLNDASNRFELADGGSDNTYTLKLQDGEALDAEAAAQPSLTVTAGGVTSESFTPNVLNDASDDVPDPVSITFDAASITSYAGSQDTPGGVTVSDGDSSVELDGNLWKRVPIGQDYAITANTSLTVTVAVGTPVSEIVAIGFDLDEDFSDADGSIYQLAGTQRYAPFVDVSDQGTDNGNGTATYVIDLSAHAGTTITNLVLVADDDNASDGIGAPVFSNVVLSDETDGPAVNTAPNVVGGGIADFTVDERGAVEVDLPFVDSDGPQALTYSYTVTDAAGADVTGSFGLSLGAGALTGTIADGVAPGDYGVAVTADDGQDTTTDTFTITIENVNEAPFVDGFVAPEPFIGKVGEPITGIDLAQFEGVFSDPDDDLLTINVEGLPAGLSVDGEGVITGTPTEAGAGFFTLVATDPDGLRAELQIPLQLDKPEVGDVVVVEAEDFTGLANADEFYVTGQAGASGSQIIRVGGNGDQGLITTTLSQNGLLDGWYQVAMTRYDETDGSAAYTLQIGDTVLSDGPSFDGTPDEETPDDTFNNNDARGNAGQSGNLKTITYQTPIFVDAGTVLTLSGTADGELLRTDKFIFTRVAEPNEAPSVASLSASTVAENADDVVIGTLTATDPDGDDAAITFSVTAASPFEVLGDELRLKAGEAFNFEADGASVDVDVTATDATGGTSVTTLTIGIEDVDETPSDVTLTNATVAENADGEVVGTLQSIDPEMTAVSFTVDDARFEVDGDDQLTLKTGETLNFETEPTVTVNVTATDGTGKAVVTPLTVTVTDANDAPEMPAGASIDDVSIAANTGTTIDLAVTLGATDEDGADTVNYAIAGAEALAAGFAVEADGTTLTVPASAAAGSYDVTVVATDGTADSQSVSFTVTVGDAGPFQTIILQGEDFALLNAADDSDPNLIRTETQNLERDPQGEDLPDVMANPGLPEFDPVTGLRPDYTGDGYLDPQGADIGGQAEITFDAPAGTYDVTVRLANGSTNPRPMTFDIDGVRTTIADTTTEEFYLWETRTFEVTLTSGGTHTLTIEQDGTNGGANIDAIAIHEPGTTVDFFAGTVTDDSADADGNLAAAPVAASVAVADADTVEFTLSGVDADIQTVEVSVDGAPFTAAIVTGEGADRVVTVDLSSFAAGVSVPVTLRVTDEAGNFADASTSVDIDADTVTVDPVTIQAEDETQVTVTDVGDPGTNPAGRAVTQAFGPGEMDVFGNDHENAIGDGWVDFGENAGDKIDVAYDAPVAGSYTLTIRYANGDTVDRPLALSINGDAAQNVAFAPSGGFDTWTDVTVTVELQDGPNTITLEIPTAANGGLDKGPNLDQVIVALEDSGGTGDDPAPEPGPRETIKINFQDGNTPEADGYLVANFEGFADRGNGFSYGFVTEASATDADGTNATPIDGSRYPTVAINERSGNDTLPDDGSLPSELTGTIDVSGYDPRLLGYAHTDLPGYPGDQTDPNERVAFELALENGWYEVTVAVGDTAGPNDSNNTLYVEGELVADWTPTAAFKTELVTTTAKVDDGFLTIDGRGGSVTEFQYLEVRELPDLTPDDSNEAPVDYASFINPVVLSENDSQPLGVQSDGTLPVDIDPTGDIVVGIDVVDGRSGILLESLNDGSVKLFETLTGDEVAIRSQTTGGFDSLTIAPDVDLKEHTSYTLVIDGFRDRGDNDDLDAPTREFEKFTTTFVTGEAPEIEAREVAFEETMEVNGFADGGAALTSVEMSPDGSKLYASSLSGTITRWDVGADGSLSNAQVLALDYFTATGRGIIGLTFDPLDPDTLWVTDNHEIPLSGRDNGVPDFSGQITKITLGSGDAFTGTAQTYVTGLPRSNGDHVTNSLEFRPNPAFTVGGDEPEYLLYLTQGSNSAMGEADSAWGFRPERLLNAAVLEVDPTRSDVPAGGFDVTTEPLPDDGNNRRFADSDNDLFNGGIAINSGQYSGNFLHFNENGVATVREGSDATSALVASFYDPTAADAPVKIFATGTRNPYDLVWHSNGFLYVPTNGSAAGGNVPDDPDTTENEGVNGVEKQDDYLFIIPGEGGTYSGHPNPLNKHYVLNGGNPTSSNDPNQVDAYPVGIDPDPDYDPDYAYSVSENRSPNGAIEYLSNTFGSSLQNAVIFTQYSSGDNLRAIIVDPATGLPVDDFILRNTDGQIISYTDPLDVIEGADGRLYMLTLNRSNGQSQIIRLDPEGTAVVDNTADAGDDLTLLVVDGTDPAAVLFQVNGLDADIQTLQVSFNNAGPDNVTLDGQNQFTADLSGESGAVTAVLTVQDDANNSKTVNATFTPGDDSGTTSTVIQPIAFTILDTDSGTLVRQADVPATHEDTDSNDANGDGLNDGNTQDNYLDPNGPAEDKASFVYNAVAAGTYSFVFRMANGSAGQDRAIAFKTGDQSVEITDTLTSSFATWQDFQVTLTLVEGGNTIVIEQTGTDGAPNIDKVTITPLDVADTTADAGGDLDLVASDLGDPANAVFTVSGADADLTSFSVTFLDETNASVTETLSADGDFNGAFTVDLSTLSGSVTAEATVSDGANTTMETATFTLDDGGVPNDGTEVLGGVEFTIYEAENAALDGPVVVTEDRTQSGDFVDFDGTADQTVSWTVAVPQDGEYQVDILYALATSKDPRPMSLSVDGSLVETLPFPPNSNEDETSWTPQTTSVDLTAGTHTIAVTAPAANGPNLDYLRITSSPLSEPLDLTADEGGNLALSVVDQTDASAVLFQVDGVDDDIETVEVAFNDGAPTTVQLDASGQFAADAGITFGTVNAVLTVTDDANNTATTAANFSVAPDGNPDADIEVESLDPTFYENRLHFSFIENPAEGDGNGQDRSFKNSGVVEITNTGSEDLEVFSAEVTGPFDLANPSALDNLALAAGQSLQVEVLFDASEIQPKPDDSQNGVSDGALTIVTNDAEDPIVTVDLAGFWQPQPESGREPNVNEVWQLFGFGNAIDGLDLDNGGESDVLDFYDLYLPVDETEVLSPYWRIADGVSEATITQIAAFHGPGGASLGIHGPGDKSGSNDISFGSHNNTDNQRILPLEGGDFFTETFDNGDIPDAWEGNEVFGIEVAGLSTDPTLNPSGSGSVAASELDARYPGYTLLNDTVIDPDGNEVPDGYTVRMFQAVDTNGVTIANTFLGVMDYTGINYDYNDNMFVVEGVTPVGSGGVLAVSGLDDAAADDRLVFTNIETPNNANGLPQNFRNEATVTISNNGIGNLDIAGLSISGADASAFEISSSATGGATLGAGQSVDVTVEFVGIDGSNDNAAVLYNDAALSIATATGDSQSVALAGLAQLQSESGEEPSVEQIVAAFGYGTEMAQGQLANGGIVEAVGDEVLVPYLQAASGSQVEVIDIAAFLTQGRISRLNKHDVGDSTLIELYAADDQQGQTILPDGHVPGAGDTGSVARATFDGSEPFGLKITVDGFATFSAWTDPDANVEDPAFSLDATNEGHYLRFFQAKDSAGNDIPNTLIAIQDYPGGENFDYNDHMFVIKNVAAYDPAGAEDGDSNGVVDTLETDSDNDGLADFFDGDVTQPSEQAAFGGTAPTLGDSLTVAADTFDTGGQGVAWNDDAGKNGGDAARGDSDVEIIGSDIAFVEAGEWVEYTIDVAQAGTYDLSFVAKAPTDAATISVSVEDGPALATVTLPDANAASDDGFGGTEFGPTDSAQITLGAGEQTLRMTFGGTEATNGYVLDLRSFTLEAVDPGGGNTEPTTVGITGAPEGTEDEPYNFDVSGFFQDADTNDTLTFTASGLPAGLSISDAGVVSGTVTGIDTDVTSTVTVTASDGEADVSATFDLTVAAETGTGVGDDQAPFPGPDAPSVGSGTLTIAAENYDQGGSGVAYNDADGLQGGDDGGRTGSDVEQTLAGDIGWIADGEWYEYTIDVATAGAYDLDMLLSFGSSGTRSASVDFYAAGATTPYASTGPIANPSTGGWTTFAERSFDGLDLQAGEQVVRVTFNGGSQDFRSFTLTAADVPDPDPAQTAFPGAAPVIGPDAVTVDATNYDDGGQGVAWNDDAGRDGGNSFRSGTDVELVGAEDDIGYVQPGEWVEYTIDVAEPGTYALSVNAKSPIAGNTITASLGDGEALATYELPDSNGGDTSFGGTTFADTLAQNVTLEAGLQTLRFTFDGSPGSNGYILDMRSFTLALDGDPGNETPDPVVDNSGSGGSEVIGQAGTVTFVQSDADAWQSVSFDQALENPSVVMGPLTFNGNQPATMRVRNVDEDGFEFQLDEWEYLDGSHIEEQVSWLAVESGAHTLADGTVIEAGNALADNSPSAVGLTADFGGTPAVFAQVTSTNEGTAVTTRMSGVEADGFTVQLQEEEAADGVHAGENLSWIAVSQGVGDGLLVGSTGDTVDDGVTEIDFEGVFETTPAFLAAMQTLDGPDTATVRASGLDATGADVFIEEETSADGEVAHTDEVVAYLALEEDTLIA